MKKLSFIYILFFVFINYIPTLVAASNNLHTIRPNRMCKNGTIPFNCWLLGITYDIASKKYISTGYNLDRGLPLVMLSDNGINWKANTISGTQVAILRNVIVGQSGTYIVSGGDILISHDQGRTWKISETRPKGGLFLDVAWNNDKQYLAISINAKYLRVIIALSTDNGLTWKKKILYNTNGKPFNGMLMGVVWDKVSKKYYAIGVEGHTTTGRLVILTSSDGEKWNKRYITNKNIQGELVKIRIIPIPNQGRIFVALGGYMIGKNVAPAILISKNGINWSLQKNGLSGINGLATDISSNGIKTVVVGTNYGTNKILILNSTDNTNWLLDDSKFARSMECEYGVIWQDNKFIIAGGTYVKSKPNFDGIILTSPDGVNDWKEPVY